MTNFIKRPSIKELTERIEEKYGPGPNKPINALIDGKKIYVRPDKPLYDAITTYGRYEETN